MLTQSEQTHREEGHVMAEAKIRVIYAAASQGTPRIAGKHQKLGGDKEGFFSNGFQGKKALLTP